MDSLSIRAARRLALARAGLLTPEPTGLPRRARGRGPTAIAAAHAVIGRFGYLQLDTVSVAGARSHTIVLLSRLEGLDARVGEELLRPGAPIFEYWGHEASWIPLALYPAFEFRRREFRSHPWWGDLIREHPKVARDLRRRIRDEGPLRSSEMEGRTGKGWWDLGVMKRVASSLWSSGELAIRERRNFQRTYDLAERVIPEDLRRRPLPAPEALETLLLAALDGHGWATTGTLASTWRLRNRKAELVATLRRLQEKGAVLRLRPGVRGRIRQPWDGSVRATASWRPGSSAPGRGRIRACCSRRSIPCCGTARAWPACSASTPCSRSSSRRLSGCTATTACPCSRASTWSRAWTSRPSASESELRVVSAHYENAEAAVARRDRQAARVAVARYAEALGLRPAW